MSRKTFAFAALALALGLLPGTAALAAGSKTGGIYTIVDDLVGGSAGGLSGDCNGTCVVGSVGQVSASTVTAGPPGLSVGGGFFNFDYTFQRLVVLLPGQKLDPRQGSGVSGSPLSQVSYLPFQARVVGADLGFNYASTATSIVHLTTSSAINLPTVLPLVAGSTIFSNIIFTTSGTLKLIATDQSNPGILSSTSSAINIFAQENSSPTIVIGIANGSIRASIGGQITGTAGSPTGISALRLAAQDKTSLQWYDYGANSFSLANPSFGVAGLGSTLDASTTWAIVVDDLAFTPSRQYFLLARSTNAVGLLGIAESTFTYSPGGGGNGAPGDGKGAAALGGALTALGCQVLTPQVDVTVDAANPIGAGGKIALKVPDGWTRPYGENPGPAQPGQLLITSPQPYTVAFNPAIQSSVTLGDNWIVYTPNVALGGGNVVSFAYKGNTPVGPQGLGDQVFQVLTQQNPGSQLKPVPNPPRLSLIPSGARTLEFLPEAESLALGPLQSSPTMQIGVFDFCGNSTNTASDLVVSFGAGNFNDDDMTGRFFPGGGGLALVNHRITIPGGTGSSPNFYYRSSTAGVSFEYLSASATLAGFENFTARFVRVLGQPLAISNVSIDTNTLQLGNLSSTITFTGGQPKPATINFTLSDPDANWEVVISSDPVGFLPGVFHRFGRGNPGRTLSWGGFVSNQFPERYLPPGGPYVVRIRVEGGVIEDKTLSAFIGPSGSIRGRLNEVAVSSGAFATVFAHGPGANFANSAVASATGYFHIFGLTAGNRYNLQASTAVIKQSEVFNLTVSSNNVLATAAGNDIGVMAFPEPAFLRLNVTIPKPAPNQFWGGANVHDADYRRNAYGTLHFREGFDQSDDGRGDFGGAVSTWTALALEAGVYDIDIDLFQLGFSTTVEGVTLTAGQITELPVALQKKANVLGWAVIPATASFGTHVSLQATKAGDKKPSLFRDTFIERAESPFDNFPTSATYGLFGLDSGSWTITARAFGFQSAARQIFIATSADIGRVDQNGQVVNGLDLFLSSHGVIRGTITVVGDSSQFTKGDFNFGPGGQTFPTGGFVLFLRAFNAQTFEHGQAAVHLSTSQTITSSTFSITGLGDGSYVLETFAKGASPARQTVAVAAGSGLANMVMQVNSSKAFLTVKLPGAPPIAPSEYRKVALFQMTNQGNTLKQDLVSANTVQYHLSSATVQLGGLDAGYPSFTALYSKTGAFAKTEFPLSHGATAFSTLDLSGSTFSLTGSVSVTGNISFSSANFSITVSSPAGILQNAKRTQFCLMGSAAPLSTSAFHMELIPLGFGGRGGSVAALHVSSSPTSFCDNLVPKDQGGPDGPGGNPFLGFVAEIQPNGAFAFNNVPPGVYLLRNGAELDNDAFNGAELPQASQVVELSTSMSGLVFKLTPGARVGGRLILPPQTVESRPFEVQLLDGNAQVHDTVLVAFSGSAEARYEFGKVPDGSYAVVVEDRGFPATYGARPRSVKVLGLDQTSEDLKLIKTGIIKGQFSIQQTLPGATTRQFLLIGQNNRSLLPNSIELFARANPWFQGGFRKPKPQCQQAAGGGGGGGPGGGDCHGFEIDENGRFTFEGVLPGVYEVGARVFNGENDSGLKLIGSFVPGAKVEEGRTTDIGTLQLNAGLEIRGAVFDVATSCPIANLDVNARPSVEQGGSEHHDPETKTDKNGNYVLSGLDPSTRFYDVFAAARGEGEQTGIARLPFEQTVARGVDASSPVAVNFTVNPAPFAIRGRVQGIVGGLGLFQPFGGHGSDDVKSPGALVFLQKTSELPTRNPIADIVFVTDREGNFDIPALAIGNYKMIVAALDYATLSRGVTISSGNVNLGTLSLVGGGTLSGTIRKADGSNPSEREVDFIAAATNDLSEIIFGEIQGDANAKTVTGYRLSGFKAGVTYRLLMDGTAGLFSPQDGRSVVFTSTSDARVLDVVLRPSPPIAFAKAKKKSDGNFEVSIELSQPLRAKTADDDKLALILSTFGTVGSLSQRELGPDRSRLTALYTPGANESSFTIRLNAFSQLTDPDSLDPVNPEFVYLTTAAFFTGIDGYHRTTLTNVGGGTLRVEGDNGRIAIPSGAFQVDSSSSVEVTLSIANENLAGRAALLGSLPGAAATIKSLKSPGSAYPPGVLKAIAATPPQINPFSGFYDVLLPLGIRTALSRPVQMTISYSSGTDPSTINLYWYNEAANAYILQQDVTGAAPVIDTVNRTITINVNHFSTFVMFQTGVAVITGDQFAGGGMEAFNFPNPFNLSEKTVTTIHPASNQVVRGTMIRFSLPLDVSGDGSIRIYNVAGERVRTIDLGNLSGGRYFYQGWDGRNDSGRDVASGIYIGQIKVGSKSKFFKMALVK